MCREGSPCAPSNLKSGQYTMRRACQLIHHWIKATGSLDKCSATSNGRLADYQGLAAGATAKTRSGVFVLEDN